MTQDHRAAIPGHDDLGRGALELLERHFAALNSGDRDAFRETAYLFPFIDGEPFERWWLGMRSLAPLSVSYTLDHIGADVSLGKEPHVAVWVAVDARSASTRRSYTDKFVVWYLVSSGSWKLGCRIHWWLDEA